jgi:hypothetical protein
MSESEASALRLVPSPEFCISTAGRQTDRNVFTHRRRVQDVFPDFEVAQHALDQRAGDTRRELETLAPEQQIELTGFQHAGQSSAATTFT